MPRLLRIVLIIVASLFGLVAIATLAAWILMPKDWIDQEAKRQAARIEGATVRWTRLSPGLSWLSLGVRIEGLYVRQPAEGQGAARLEAKVQEIFVSFRLLPLLARRVEVSAARVSGAGIAMTDRGEPPPTEPGKSPAGAAGVALILPKVDFDGIDIRTRDPLGGGVDLRRLSGGAEFEGSIDRPRTVRIAARCESLYWKPSAREPRVALPAPLGIDAAAEGRDGGAKLQVTRGVVTLGPLRSDLSGEIRLPTPDRKEPDLALALTGKPQQIRSTDEAFRPLAALTPATWSTSASWDVRINGSVAAPIQTGRMTLQPLKVTSGPNAFALDHAVASWGVQADKTFTAHANAGGAGLKLEVDAKGSTAPGGGTDGTLFVSGPAVRLNGLVPNTPTWTSGDLECRASFSLRPPAPPQIRWNVKGKNLGGTVPGLARPVSRLGFDIDGDDRVATIRAFNATVGSTTATATGTIRQGKPLGTATLQATLDRFVAEEWAPPPPAKGSRTAKTAAAPSAPPPIPFQAFDATVSIGEVQSGKMAVRDVVVPVKFADGKLAAAPIRGKIGTGSLAGSLQMTELLSNPAYALNLDVQKAPAQDLLAGLLPFKVGFTGLASGSVNLMGRGLPGPAVSDSLRGALQGTVEDGKILETPLVAGIRKALGLVSGGGQSGAELAFRTLTSSLRIDRGRLLLDKVKGDLGKDLFEMTGSMGLDKSLDLDLLLRLAPDRIKGGTGLAEFARYARDKDGRLPLTVKVTGNAINPKISIKPAKTIEIAGSRLQQEIARGLAESARRDSARRDTTRRDSTRATDSTKVEDPLQKGRDALKRLLGK
jgi:AsmA-like C-terminal region